MLEAKGTARWETLSVEKLGTFEDRKETSMSKESGTGKPRAWIGSNVWGLLENIQVLNPPRSYHIHCKSVPVISSSNTRQEATLL